MKVIEKDLFAVTEGVILLPTTKEFPLTGIYEENFVYYPDHRHTVKDFKAIMLGDVLYTQEEEGLGVASLVCIDPNIAIDTKFSYSAFTDCLKTIKKMHKALPKVPFYMPYRFGCGDAKGSWDTVSIILQYNECDFITACKRR